jgi:hypothetical protein
VIDASVPVLSHDYTHLFLRDVVGRHGLIVIGVGKAGERGIEMLYRFSDICERLDNSRGQRHLCLSEGISAPCSGRHLLIGRALQPKAISLSGR